MWDLVDNRSDIARLEDQFAPFIQPLFGTSDETLEAGYFNGTIFRFPLRMQAGQSDLCQTVYSPQKVKDLFNLLEADAHSLLLFLKSLKTIEVYEKVDSDLAPTMLMTVKISQNTEMEITTKRAELIEQIGQRQCGSIQSAVSVTYNMTTELTQQRHVETEPEVTKCCWVISQFYGCDEDVSSVREFSSTLGVLPWVAVAVLVESTEEIVSGFRDRPHGHIFCFLPLPREPESPTGLRVHVHGYFAVEQNRRHIKRRTSEQINEKITDEAILWNEYLINCLLPKALVNLAQYIAESWSVENAVLHRNLMYSVIPDMAAVTIYWKPLAVAFYQQLPSLPVFYSPVNEGRFLQMKDVLFDDIEDTSCLTELIRRILFLNQTDLASVPSYILQQLGSSAARVPARLVCTALKNAELRQMLEDSEIMLLLRYLVDGLKGQESVIASDVWHIASRLNIVLCSDSDSATACLQCGNELVGFLEQHCYLLAATVPSCSDSLLNLLKQVRWVPVMRCRPDRYPKPLPFHGENYGSLLACPSDVLSSEHCFLVGSVKQCLDTSVSNIARLAAEFELTREPNIDDVAAV